MSREHGINRTEERRRVYAVKALDQVVECENFAFTNGKILSIDVRKKHVTPVQGVKGESYLSGT
ncbi:hypothetical protein BCY91_06800 [Pelobium manganitolerans]|uniref:Uncharacterized protein n=1 Tax=Pelobium manganitolerans TaxID=1842495 RepID=A0A419S518_9SPHI|nr:hypothetical protein BCY91_06800 [Pelobium manganitolerans]